MKKKKSDVYYRFTERNVNKLETRNFYIPASGNIRKLKHLYDIIAGDDAYSFDFMTQYSEDEVNQLVSKGKSGYYRKHNKVKSIIVNDRGSFTLEALYKGGIFRIDGEL